MAELGVDGEWRRHEPAFGGLDREGIDLEPWRDVPMTLRILHRPHELARRRRVIALLLDRGALVVDRGLARTDQRNQGEQRRQHQRVLINPSPPPPISGNFASRSSSTL